MVEHSLQGEDASLPIIEFIAAGVLRITQQHRKAKLKWRGIDKQLAGVDRKTIAAQLTEVGFDEDRQKHPVGSLSGGWKMKVCFFFTLPRWWVSDACVSLS